MNRNEFIKKFPVGSKVRLGHWSKDKFWEVIFYGEANFFYKDMEGDESCFCYGVDWLPYEEPKEELRLWDVVFDDTLRKEGVIVGDVPCGDLWVFVPDRVMCRTIAPERLKKVEGKVTMAPALFFNRWQGNLEISSQIFSSKENAEKKLNSHNVVRWPHSIASLTIENLTK